MTDIDPAAWLLFERVARTGSISAAAREAGVAKGTASKALAALEARIGAPLFHRTSRQLVPTVTGERLIAHARALRSVLDAASEAASEEADGLAGRIRVAAPLSFGLNHLAGALAEFQLRHPAVAVELCLEDMLTDLIGGGYDIGLRIGTLADSSLRVRRIGTMRTMLAAAPTWIAAHGKPRDPAVLGDRDGLVYANSNPPGVWKLARKGRSVEVRPRPRLTANNGDVLADAAVAGLGAVLLPEFLIAAPLADGRLVRLLPEWEGPLSDLALLSPPGPTRPVRVQALVDHLAGSLAAQCRAVAE